MPKRKGPYIPRRDLTTGFGVVDFQSQLLIMKGEICSCDVIKAIKQSVAAGKISPELKQFL